MSLVHAQYGILCFFFGSVVDHRVIFGSTDPTGTNVSEVREDFVDVVLSDVGAQVLGDN